MLLKLEALYRSGQYKKGQILGSVAKQTQRLVFWIKPLCPLPIYRFRDNFDAKIGSKPIHAEVFAVHAYLFESCALK